MKKYIFSVLMAAMAVFTFSSCEDVPAPYGTPNKPSTPEATTSGTEADPYTVTDAKIVGTGTNVFVKGYIVGYIPTGEKSLNSAVFGTIDENVSTSNVLIAASADESDVNKCMPIQLSNVRDAVNLSANPGNLGKEVTLCGNILTYFGAIGLKECVWAKIGDKEVGTKPGGTTPDTPSTGKGSASEPYTIAEAIAAIKAGAPTYEVYLTGIVSEVDFYNETYKSLSYYISDDGKSKDMQVYSGKGLNGADFTSKDDLKVGQKVTIKGIIKSFNKNGTDIMEVDKSSTIIKIEGEGTGGEVTPKPDTPDTGNGKITFADDHKTLTLENSKATAGESVSFDFTAQNYENQTDMTTIKLSDGTTITFDANGEKNGSKYYTTGTAVRVYKNNKIIVNGTKEIAKIIFHCNAPYTNKGETVNCDGNETATINFSGKTATYTNVFTGTTGGGVQLRFSSIEIVYAK